MAEFLFLIDPARRASGQQIGEPVMIENDGHPWGAGELNPAIFRLIKVPTIGKALARAVFFRDGVPRSELTTLASLRDAVLAARAETPPDPAKIANAMAAFDAHDRRVRRYPRRRFHVDLSALGAGGTKTAVRLRESSLRKGLTAFREAREQGATEDSALAASIAAATPVTDFTTASAED